MRRWWVGAPMAQFDTAPRPIDQVILEFAGRSGARISRTDALSVPAVQRGRNMICSIATLPLAQKGPQNRPVRNPLLEQIDPDVANVVTLAQTLEDLLFESISWWKITAQDSAGFPVFAQHLDVSTVSVDPPKDRPVAPLPSGIDPRDMFVWVDGQPVLASQIIRFDSPNPALLKVGGRAIRRAMALDMAAAMYADDPRPQDYFTPAENADEIDDDEVASILAEWKAQRKKRGTAWIPLSMKYNSVDAPSPAELQLVELQKQASLDIANALGIDPEDLGISTTSRTYANAIDRRRDRINDVLAPYMRAITDRLSMGDVTRRGNRVEFLLDDYMKANPTERWACHKIAKEIGVFSPEQIRVKEGEEPGAPKPPPAPVPVSPSTVEPDEDADAPEKVAASTVVGATFDAGADTTLHFADIPVLSFSVNRETRIVEGLAMPYGVIGTKFGIKFRFLPNSLKWNERAPGRVKLLRQHNMERPIGYAKLLSNTPNGLRSRWKVARGAEGDEALQLAEDGVLDGMSVGVDFDLSKDATFNEHDEVWDVHRADLRETSLTPMPVFDDARLTKVAASREGVSTVDPCSTCGQVHAEGVTTCAAPPAPPAPPAGMTLSQDQLTALLTRPGAIQALVSAQQAVAAPAQPNNSGGLNLSAEQVDALIKSGQLGVLLGVPQLTPGPTRTEPTERQPVDPTRRTGALAASQVGEPLPYRFDREGNLTKGATYDFSTDLVSGSRGDGEAMLRCQKFLEAMAPRFTRDFDVDKADAASLNPNVQRPDMYVDQREFQSPVWDAISKGTLADSTPFVLPKFNTSTGLVAAHVEAVEPTPGTFTATAQTITPSAVSGKVEITREAWDQGGNPQLSGIIWRQMTRAWFEALEASAVALLDGLTPTGVTLTTNAVNAALVGELEAFLAGLQFIRGGFRMRDFFIQIDLYKRLAAAVDTTGRKLLPLLGAVNASGEVSELFADLNVSGLRGRPSWALAASGAVAASSYLFDRSDVHGWATAPQRLEFQYRVAYVDVAVWGYKALANTDLTGVREVIYDPTT